ncbi:MAG: permease [Candidatus Pacebacteria bacterium]|nr:permease [Candidatus Paceibacterota bacterium]
MNTIDTAKKVNNGKWIFLAIVAGLYFVTAVADLSLVKDALFDFAMLVKKVAPVLAFVFVLIFLSNLYFDPQKINKFVGEGSGVKGWITSIIGGVLSAGPAYVWYPLLGDWREKGMKDGFIITFFYSRAIKLPILPVMVYYFGLPFTLILAFYMILFSVINGIFVEKFLARI